MVKKLFKMKKKTLVKIILRQRDKLIKQQELMNLVIHESDIFEAGKTDMSYLT